MTKRKNPMDEQRRREAEKRKRQNKDVRRQNREKALKTMGPDAIMAEVLRIKRLERQGHADDHMKARLKILEKAYDEAIEREKQQEEAKKRVPTAQEQVTIRGLSRIIRRDNSAEQEQDHGEDDDDDDDDEDDEDGDDEDDASDQKHSVKLSDEKNSSSQNGTFLSVDPASLISAAPAVFSEEELAQEEEIIDVAPGLTAPPPLFMLPPLPFSLSIQQAAALNEVAATYFATAIKTPPVPTNTIRTLSNHTQNTHKQQSNTYPPHHPSRSQPLIPGVVPTSVPGTDSIIRITAPNIPTSSTTTTPSSSSSSTNPTQSHSRPQARPHTSNNYDIDPLNPSGSTRFYGTQRPHQSRPYQPKKTTTFDPLDPNPEAKAREDAEKEYARQIKRQGGFGNAATATTTATAPSATTTNDTPSTAPTAPKLPQIKPAFMPVSLVVRRPQQTAPATTQQRRAQPKINAAPDVGTAHSTSNPSTNSHQSSNQSNNAAAAYESFMKGLQDMGAL